MNTQPNDGGPAFPRAASEYTPNDAAFDVRIAAVPYTGMSLLDYFAGQALQGYMANTEFSMGHDDPYSVCNNCVSYAETIVAILRERKGGDQ